MCRSFIIHPVQDTLGWLKGFWLENFTNVDFQRRLSWPQKEFALEWGNIISLHNRGLYYDPSLFAKEIHNYVPSVGIMFCSARLIVQDNPVLLDYFPTASFPVWCNHPNLKNILSNKQNISWTTMNTEYTKISTFLNWTGLFVEKSSTLSKLLVLGNVVFPIRCSLYF